MARVSGGKEAGTGATQRLRTMALQAVRRRAAYHPYCDIQLPFFPVPLKVTANSLKEAINRVGDFCTFLDARRQA